jgi:hypothetical protein
MKNKIKKAAVSGRFYELFNAQMDYASRNGLSIVCFYLGPDVLRDIGWISDPNSDSDCLSVGKIQKIQFFPMMVNGIAARTCKNPAIG